MRAAVCLLALTAGCIEAFDPLDPQVGAAARERCADQDSDPRNDVSFAQDVLPLFKGQIESEPGCSCHQPTDPNPIGLQEAGLNLGTLLSLRAGGVRSGASIVVDGQPCASLLWQKLTSAPPFGARMPFDGPPFVSEQRRRLIADWIAEGARDN